MRKIKLKQNMVRMKRYGKAVAFLIFVALFLMFFYVTQIKPNRELPTEFQSGSMGSEVSYQLKSGSVIEQEIELKRGRMQAIGIRFQILDIEASQTAFVELEEKEGGKLLGRWEVNSSELETDQYKQFQISPKLVSAKGKTYVIRCSVEDSAISNGMAVVLLTGNRFHDGVLKINGHLHQGEELQIKLYGDNVFFCTIYRVVVLIILAVLLLCIVGVFHKNWSVHVVFLAMGLMLGSVFIMVMPPYTTPDEIKHAATIYYNANTVLHPENNRADGVPLVREDDLKLDARQKELSIAVYNYVQDHLFEKLDSTATATYGCDKINVPMTAHLPQTIGVIIGMGLGLNGILTLYLGKLFGLLFYLLCVYFAIRAMPWGKMILFTIALFPMSLQLATSLSYDSVVNALSFLFIGYSMKLICEKNKVTWKDFALLAIIAAWMVPCKVAYIFVCLICVLIPGNKVKKRKNYYIGITLVLSAGLLAMIMLRMGYLLKISQGGASGMSGITGEELSGYTIGWILSHFKESAKIIFNTIYYSGDDYLQTMVGGRLGWLQIPVSGVILFGFLLTLLLGTIPSQTQKDCLNGKQRLLLVLLCGMMFGGILIALWLDWTTMDSLCIQGVQGRYFLPFLPLLFLAIRGGWVKLKRNINYELCFAVFLMNIFAISQILSFVFTA